jgi:tyrosyl-tRNA synthetase
MKKMQERDCCKKLAAAVTQFVHGNAALEEALQATAKAFAEKDKPAEDLTIEDIEAMHGVTQIDFAAAKINAGIDVVSFLAETGIEKSKGDARKMVQAGGISINRKR